MLFDTITYVSGADHNYDLAASTLSTPSDGDVIMRHTATRAFDLPQNLAGSYMDAQIGPSAGVLLMTLSVNGVSQGTFSFADAAGAAVSVLMSSATVGGNIASGDVAVAAGDIVELTLTTVSSSDKISVTFKTAAA